MTCWYHETPSKLCDKCMDDERRKAAAAPAPVSVSNKCQCMRCSTGLPHDLDFSGSVLDRFTSLGESDAKWEQRAREFTEEKRADLLAFPDLETYLARCDAEDACKALCSFAARMAMRTHVDLGSWTYKDGVLSYRGPVDMSAAKAPAVTVTSVDREKGVITFSSGSALRDMSGMGAASFEPSMAVERVVPAGHPLAGFPIESRYVMSGVDRINPRGLDAWLPKPSDGASFLGVDRSKPAELNAETFLAALMRDPPAPQPVYLHPREYEEMQRTVADQMAEQMYASTTPAGRWEALNQMQRVGFISGGQPDDDDDDCDCCPCCCECGSDE